MSDFTASRSWKKCQQLPEDLRSLRCEIESWFETHGLAFYNANRSWSEPVTENRESRGEDSITSRVVTQSQVRSFRQGKCTDIFNLLRSAERGIRLGVNVIQVRCGGRHYHPRRFVGLCLCLYENKVPKMK